MRSLRSICAVVLLASSRAVADNPVPVTVLQPGSTLRQSADAGQFLKYRIELPAGQTLSLRLRQLNDRAPFLQWSDAAALPPLAVSAGRQAYRDLTLIAGTSRVWDFSVGAKTKGYASSFELTLGPTRAATAAAQRRAVAEAALARADELRGASGSTENGSKGGTSAQQRAAAAYARAAGAWRAAADACGLRQSLSGLARLRFAHGDYRGAAAADRDALALNCAPADDPGHMADAAELQRTLGAALNYAGDYVGAIAAQERALALYLRTGDSRFQGVVQGNLTANYAATGQSGKALDSAQAALRLAESSDDIPGIEFSRERVAAMLLTRGELSPALELYRQTLQQLEDKPYPMVENMAWDDLGLLYSELGDAEQSREAYARAQAAAIANDDRAAEAEALRNQGKAALAAGAVTQAQQLFGRVLELARQGGYAGLEAEALLGLGRCATAAGDWPEAQTQLAAASARHGGDQALRVELNLALGELDSRRQRWASAHARFARAAAGAARTHAGNLAPVALASLARSEQALGRLQPAADHSGRALQLIETQRLRINDPRLRTSYFSSRRAYYGLYIDILMQLDVLRPGRGFAAAALQASERARARTLQDMLLERRLSVPAPVEATLLAQERAAEDRLHLLAYQGDRQPGGGRAPLQQRIDEASRELDELRGRIRRDNPRYAEISDPQNLGADEMRQLLGDDTVLLEYWLGEAHSYLWTLNRGGLSSRELPPRAAIEADAVRLRETLSGPAGAAGTPIEALPALELRAAESARELGARLGQQLLPEALGGYGNVVVVADGALQRIPFERLLPDSAPDSPAFVYLPSIATVRWLRDTPAGPPSAVAVMADPVFSAADPRLGAAAGELPLNAAAGAGLPRLPHTRVEAQDIAALMPPQSSWVALDFAANRRDAMTAQWAAYPLVHFATHTLLDLRHPELSGIVLSLFDAAGRPQDGYLRMNDIYNLRFPVQLVFLSACEAAGGSDEGEEGVYSLSRAFFYAGARRVLANLWPVDDRASAQFVKSYYEALLHQKQTPGQALRSAQRKLADDPRWHLPYYWAGYVLQGDWR